MAWLAVPLGVLCLVIVGSDIILTVFTPSLRGRLSVVIARAVWRALRPLGRRSGTWRELAGPAAFISVIMCWVVLIALGWALIYWPFLPDSFLVDFGADLERDSAGNFIAALYLSIIVMTTLGFGDIVPTEGWLRIVIGVEALLGFGLLTTGISWFLSIDPALARRRILTQQIALVRNAERLMGDGTRQWHAASLEQSLRDFANGLVAVHSDLIHFPITYYFRNADPDHDLAANIPYLLFLAQREQVQATDATQALYAQAVMLEHAATSYLHAVAREFLRLPPDATRDDIVRAYMQDGGR